jgi:heme-degrading monooxygenase HmoA
MGVTEIAILQSVTTTVTDELRRLLNEAQAVQDKWCADNYESSPTNRGTGMFEQIEDPAKILVTAQWDSVAAHWEWIGSDENKAIMGDLGSHIKADDFLLCHLDAEVFSLPPGQGETSLLDSPVISVGIISVNKNDEEDFSRKFDEVKGILQDFARPHLARWGWVVDGTTDQFILVCGWDSVEAHGTFANSPGFSKYSEMRSFTSDLDIKHYKRFM